VIEGKLEGRVEMTGRRGRRRKQLLDDLKENKILEIERGSTRSHSVENSLWKRLQSRLSFRFLYKQTPDDDDDDRLDRNM
jgi:hypothetical protein